MDNLFQKQFWSNTSRLPRWDDSTACFYFVTICAHKYQWFLGEILKGKMQLNPLGKTAHENWGAIPDHHKNVVLDAFVIMPNPIHGILTLMKDEITLERLHATSLRSTISARSNYYRSISPQKGSLSAIIRSYKSSVSRHIRKILNPKFAWQPRFYDHIIRTARDLENLRLYIETNLENWGSKNTYNTKSGVTSCA